MKPILHLLLLIAVLNGRAQTPCPSPAPAPACATAASDDKRLDDLTAEVEALREKASLWERILARLPRISGYVQVGYSWSENASTFFVKRARLNLAGDIGSKIDYRMQVEFVSPRLVDLYVRYRPFEALNLQVGEFKIPFSIENTDYPPLRLELIDYPMALRFLMGFSDLCGLSATGRDLGAQLYGGFWKRGDYSVVNYNVGVFNGEGLNVRDRNRSKDFVARLTLRPARGLLLSGSYYRGEFGDDYLRRTRYGAGACYDRGPVVLRGEWIGGRTGPLASDGWYALAGWRATRTLMPVVRYDTFREDDRLRDSRRTDYTAGLLWQPLKYLRCQLNYTCETYTAPASPSRSGIDLLLTGIF